jgi:hypothetical protein
MEKYYVSYKYPSRLCYFDGLENFHIQLNSNSFAIVQSDIHIEYQEIDKKEFQSLMKCFSIFSTMLSIINP